MIWSREKLSPWQELEAGSLTGTLNLRAIRYQAALSVPLRNGVEASASGMDIRLSEIEIEPEQMQVRIQEARPAWSLRQGYPPLIYVLVHRDRGEAVRLRPDYKTLRRPDSLSHLAFQTRRTDVFARAMLQPDESRDAAWFQEAELVALLPTCIGRVKAAVDWPRLQVNSSSGVSIQQRPFRRVSQGGSSRPGAQERRERLPVSLYKEQ